MSVLALVYSNLVGGLLVPKEKFAPKNLFDSIYGTLTSPSSTPHSDTTNYERTTQTRSHSTVAITICHY